MLRFRVDMAPVDPHLDIEPLADRMLVRRDESEWRPWEE
jgi:hypothetical protein